jgi:hypothetical protein
VAAVLSFLIPGLGQLYKGSTLAGLAWWLIVDGMYTVGAATLLFCVGFLILPVALFLHVICIFDAASV